MKESDIRSVIDDFFAKYEEVNGFTFDESEKTLMRKQDFCCESCGHDFRTYYSDFYVVNDWNQDASEVMLCRECYEDNYQTLCVICEELYDSPSLEDHNIFVNQGIAEENDLCVGIYQVISYPFFYGNILTGFEGLFVNALRLIKEIDISKARNLIEHPDHGKYDYDSGNICECCVREWTVMPRLFYKIGVNEVFKSPDGLHEIITKKGIIKDGV